MTGMRAPADRPRLAGVALLPVVLLVATLVAGCGSGDNPGDSADSPSLASQGETADGSDEPDKPDASDDPDDAESSDVAPSDLPPEVEQVCAPYTTMVAALEAIDYDQDPDDIAAELAPVMKEWAAQVPDLERPPDLDAATWRGLRLLAERILALPDKPTNDEIEAVEKDLTDQQIDDVEAAGRWFKKSCGVS